MKNLNLAVLKHCFVDIFSVIMISCFGYSANTTINTYKKLEKLVTQNLLLRCCGKLVLHKYRSVFNYDIGLLLHIAVNIRTIGVCMTRLSINFISDIYESI